MVTLRGSASTGWTRCSAAPKRPPPSGGASRRAAPTSSRCCATTGVSEACPSGWSALVAAGYVTARNSGPAAAAVTTYRADPRGHAAPTHRRRAALEDGPRRPVSAASRIQWSGGTSGLPGTGSSVSVHASPQASAGDHAPERPPPARCRAGTGPPTRPGAGRSRRARTAGPGRRGARPARRRTPASCSCPSRRRARSRTRPARPHRCSGCGCQTR